MRSPTELQGSLSRVDVPAIGLSPDPSALAKRAGLVHRGDDRPGIRRRRAGRGFTYLDPNGRRLGGEERRRIEQLAVPPAWTDVWISPESNSHLLACGVDADGRKQYLYHPKWAEAANAAKFERLADFAEPLSVLRAYVDRTLRTGGDDWACAAIVRLIDDALIRPGSFRRFRDVGTVGAVTLHGRHVETSRRRVHLNFTGKHDIEHEIQVEDPLLARRISELLDRTGDDQPVFVDTSGTAIDAPRVNRFISTHAGSTYTAKDLRTWGATCLVAEQLAATHDPDADADVLIREAITSAADRLGNTVAVCRSSYVAPAVVDGYRSGELHEAWRRSRRATWLSRCEQAVRRILTDS